MRFGYDVHCTMNYVTSCYFISPFYCLLSLQNRLGQSAVHEAVMSCVLIIYM